MTPIGIDRAERVRAVRAVETVNGIDWLEVATGEQRQLEVTFVHPLPGEPGAVPAGQAALGLANIRIAGGVRVTGIRVTGVVADGRTLTITVDRAGDYSLYELAVVAGPDGSAPPPGFDPLLATIAVNFKVDCPTDLDCVDLPAPAATPPSPQIDYLAKDYPTFRRTMLDRMAATAPGWRERSPADAMITIAEALAYAADHASYLQDAVATEAYLGIARLRPSLRRHARLLDYRVSEGTNARAFVAFSVASLSEADGATLPRGTAITTGGQGVAPVLSPEEARDAMAAGATVFETMHNINLSAARNRIGFHDWSGAVSVLRRGATRATLVADPAPALSAGDVIVLAETAGPATGLPADADPQHRAAVRLVHATPDNDPIDGTPIIEIEWAAADALRFDLTLRSRAVVDGVPAIVATAHALGNVVLADEGLTVAGAPGIEPAAPEPGARYYPQLSHAGVVHAEPYDHVAARSRPADATLAQDERRALPAILLSDGTETWQPRPDLLGSDRFAREFVVEPDPVRGARLRFGDGVLGKAPGAGQSFSAVFRTLDGAAGAAGHSSLTRVVTRLSGVTGVTNPLPAAPRALPETAEEIRRYAPEAFRTQRRAVTAEDWKQAAEAFPGVSRARADMRWTGSWYTVFIAVDRAGGLPVAGDGDFVAGLLRHLDALRVVGYDLELRDPIYVPLEIRLRICLRRGYAAGDIATRLAAAFSSQDLPASGRGLFHPDNFSFGDPLYLSALFAAALAIDGVASTEPLRFAPRGRAPGNEIADGLIRPGEAAILRCDGDPNRPENGVIDFDVVEP